MKHGFSRLNNFRYFLAWPGFLSLNARVLVRISVWEGLEHPRHRKNMSGGGRGGEWVNFSLGRFSAPQTQKKICWEGAGGGVGEFGKIRAPQTQKKYVGGEEGGRGSG